MENTSRKELHETIQKARKMFPGELIAYDLDGDVTITEFLEKLKNRIAEAEAAKQQNS